MKLYTLIPCILFTSAPLYAFEAGDILLRGRMVVIHPYEKANIKPVGGVLHVDTPVTPSVDAVYFLDENLALEFIPGLIRHHAKVTGTTRGDKDLGAIWAIAPTVLMQYHFSLNERVKPYIGMGMAHVTYLEDTDVDIEYDDDIAGVAQLGVDIALDEEKRWWANMDIKKVWVGTQSSQSGGRVTGDITLNPITVGTGIGYRF